MDKTQGCFSIWIKGTKLRRSLTGACATRPSDTEPVLDAHFSLSLGDVSHFFSLSTGQYHNKLSLSHTTHSKEILLLIYYHIDDFFFTRLAAVQTRSCTLQLKKSLIKHHICCTVSGLTGRPPGEEHERLARCFWSIKDTSLPPFIDLASLPSSSSRLPLPFN